MYTIYALIDPRTSQIRYVGMTQQHPEARLTQHLKLHSGTRVKNAWLRELQALSVKPVVVSLEYTEDEDIARNRESYWLLTAKKCGWDLTNFVSLPLADRFSPQQIERRRQRSERVQEHSLAEARKALRDVVESFFAEHPDLLAGPARGVADLARLICAEETGNTDNYEAYKSRAHKLFHEFRDTHVSDRN